MNNVYLLATVASICAIQNIFIAAETLTPFVNERIQYFVNKLFHYLKIEKHFKHYYKIKVLLNLYDDLNKVIELNWRIYSDIKNNVTVDNVTDNMIYKVVEEALHTGNLSNTIAKYKDVKDEYKLIKERRREIPLQALKGTEHVKYTKTSKKSVTNATDDEENQILDNLFDKINNLTADDLINQPLNKNYLEINNQKSFQLPKRIKDLKSWDPKEYSESFMSRRRLHPELVEDYPFVASIHILGELICTGSIISKDAIITAASCIPYSYNSDMISRMPHLITVRVGTDFADRFGEKYSVKDVEFHPQYESRTLKNNLALLKVKLKIYSRQLIMKIRPDEGKISRNSLLGVQILGFGAGSEDSDETKQLEVVNLNVDPIDKCTSTYSRKFVSEANFCASLLSSRTARCNGDMGAPAVSNNRRLVGVVSFGSPTCRSSTVFTSVSFHHRWISDVIQKWNNEYDFSPARNNYVSTRLYIDDFDKFEPTTPSTKDYSRQKEKIFDEIHAIFEYIKDPFSILRNEFHKDVVADYKDDDEDPFDFIKEETTKEPVNKHPLVNKSVVPIPDVHYPTLPETTRIPTTAFSRPDIGLPDWIPYEYIEEYIKNSEELDYYIKKILNQEPFGIERALDIDIPPQKSSKVTKKFLWGQDYHYYPKPSDNGRFDWG